MNISNVPQPSRWANKADWEQNKTIITQLYAKNTLPKVMKIMESRGFKATMYRQRIKDWGLDKNNKDVEMQAIVRKHEGRVAKGKTSMIRVRDRDIDYRDVVRYWKRKHLSIDAVLALRSMSKTPEAVEFLTPMPSPIMTPEALANPERIFLMLRDYHQASFEAGTWISIGESLNCQTTKVSNVDIRWTTSLFNHYMLYTTLIEKDAFQEASSELDRLCVSIEKVILAEDPDTFATVLRAIHYAYLHQQPKLGLDILNHISAVGGKILGDQHPFKLVCGRLASLDLVDRRHDEDILCRCSKLVYETFKRYLGPLHRTTLDCLLDHFVIVRYSKGCSELLQLELCKLLHECETTLGPDDDRTLSVRYELAWNYITRSEYNSSREEAQVMIVQKASKTLQIRGLEALALSLYRLGEIHEAFRVKRQAIDLAIRNWGGDDSEVQGFMLRLESWMLKQGMPESATQVHEERLRLRDSGTDLDADDTVMEL
ncbi:MAG: hypothetical protein Q9195_009176 [Heterodermia aff. obscurata]